KPTSTGGPRQPSPLKPDTTALLSDADALACLVDPAPDGSPRTDTPTLHLTLPRDPSAAAARIAARLRRSARCGDGAWKDCDMMIFPAPISPFGRCERVAAIANVVCCSNNGD